MWKIIQTVELCVTILSCFVIHQSRSQTFTNGDLEFVEFVQKSFCGARSLCILPEKVLGGSANPLPTNTTRNVDTLPVTVPEFINPDCCKPCSCNTSTCFDFGNCCPDILDTLPTLEEAQKPKRVSCQNMSIRAIGVGESFWVYGLCSKQFVVGNNQSAADIKSRCEERQSYFDLDSRLPVIDPITQRVYANKFCAMCGFANETNLIPTTPRLACYEGKQLTEEIFRSNITKAVLNTESCDLEFIWPSAEVDFSIPFCRQVETQCNVTGLWKVYDPLIEAACHIYRADYNFIYNNIFCYMCNEVETLTECTESAGRQLGTLSFAAVLDFSRGGTSPRGSPVTTCSGTQFYDHYKNVCRDLTCIFPRIIQDGQCVNVGGSVTEVAYKLQMKFQTIGIYESTEIDSMVPMLSDYVSNLLTEWGSMDAVFSYRLFYNFAFKVVDSPQATDPETTQATTTVPAVITQTKPRRKKRQADTTSTEPPLVDKRPADLPAELPEELPEEIPENQVSVVLAVDYILWEVEWYFNPLFSGYHSKDFLDNILLLDETNTSISDQFFGKSFSFNLYITDYETGQVGNSPVDPVDNKALSQFPINIFLPNADFLLPVYAPIQNIKQTLICPLVTIDTNEFGIIEMMGQWLFVKELNTTFESKIYKRELGNENKSIYSICKDAYASVTDTYMQVRTTDVTDDNGVTPQGVLSVVCACISILCSFITLVTYLLFRELRTQPGINNMLLCVYLICAQTFFTFATIQDDTVSESVCSFFGALTHFFWLMVVFAMNVCCFHMVMVFIGQPANRSKRSDTRLVKSIFYTVYCVCSSLVFVAINIVVVFVDTDQEETGYGGGLCYISRPEMVGYVFALPLGVVLLINLVFFVTVIVKISRSPTVSSSNKKDRNYFKIYAKLSSITGLTWIFGFLFQFTDQAVFEYIFIILNGGIGVLIFFSFVFNRRNYKRYRGMIAGKTLKGKDSTLGKSSKTQESTLNSVSQSTTET